MWRMISRLAPVTLATSLAFAGLSASPLVAASVQTYATPVLSYDYTTTGSIGDQSSAPIRFIGAGSQTLTTPGTFALGQFDVANVLPSTGTLTYNNTPFTINLIVPGGSGSGSYTYQISGNLNGSIFGTGTSSMVATVSSITGLSSDTNGTMSTPPFPAANLVVTVPQGINPPNLKTGGDGFTTLYAQVSAGSGPPDPIPAPEPASIAVFGVGLVAWGIRRRLSRSKVDATV